MGRVAVDAMGGDHAPLEIIAGALLAAGDGHEVTLVGDEAAITPILDQLGGELPVVHASEVIGMGDHPTRSLRERPDSSIVVAADLVRDGKADAFISAGSTGAAMAAAVFRLGRLKGVQRPAIASVIPAPKPIILLDSGANPDVKPEHLVEFAVLGTVMAETYYGVDPVRVGLLNIGEEPGKGRELERVGWDQLTALDARDPLLTFVGNVEGRDLATGKIDVIVTDGYAGNIALKTAEGTISLMALSALEEIQRLDEAHRPGAMAMLEALRRRFDYEHTGGAHLLGTNGVVVISHGSSNRSAISQAIRMADEGADRGLVDRVRDRLAADLEAPRT
ncbi:MAG: phosphate acyltransferase PlsX [Acidimicrobiia bacterium]|nr:phosphate acyltransferase PlsX [Acidimicrobiia bacterium]